MADQPNNSQINTQVGSPTASPIPSNQTITLPVTAPLSFGKRIQADLKYLWENDKVFLLIFGLLILLAKSFGFLQDLFAAGSAQELKNAKAKDAVLQQQENAANDQANILVQQAQQLPSQQPQVGLDWNKSE